MTSLSVAIVIVAVPAIVWSHGVERHFGTAINGAGGPARGAPMSSPEFSLLAIETTAGDFLAALSEGRREPLPELASRLSSLVRELKESIAARDDLETAAMSGQIASLDAGSERILTALHDLDHAELERELSKLKDAALELQRTLASSP